MTYRTLLRRFFEDRDFDERIYQADAPDGTTHIFETGSLIEQILAAPEREAESIWLIIQKLDITNQPDAEFHRFFQHLVECYATTSGNARRANPQGGLI
jgi:hypothetical protein